MTIVALPGAPPINMVRTGPRGRPPVLLLHAVGLDLTWWDHQFAALSAEHDVIAFDMPGHGLSGPLGSPPSFDILAAIAAGVLEHADAGPAHIVGISMGGMVAQALALARPDLLHSLTLVATLCTFPDAVRDALRQRARLARQDGMAAIVPLSLTRWFPAAFRERRPDVLDRAAKTLLPLDAAFHAAMWDMIAELDLGARLPDIARPTLVIAGSEDDNAPVAASRQIAGLIPGAEFTEIAGSGHFPPFETPDVFNAALRRFLRAPGAAKS